MSSSGGDAAVNKLLGKLRESQDLFDNLENLFDTKVRELGVTEGDMLRTAGQITSIQRMISTSPRAQPHHDATYPRPNLTSPPTVGTSLFPTPSALSISANVVSPAAPPAPTPGTVEASLLHERLRQMQVEHAEQIRAHTEATERSTKTRVEQEVLQRVASHNNVVLQLKEEVQRQKDEADVRVSDMRHDLERSREAVRRTEEHFRETLALREQEIKEEAAQRMERELRVQEEAHQVQVNEMERLRADAEEVVNELMRKEQSLQVANDAVQELKGQHATTVEAMQTLHTKHQSYSNEAQQLKSSLQLVTDSRTQLQREYEQLQSSYDIQASTLKQVKDDAGRKCDAYEQLKNEFQMLRTQVQDVHGVNEMKTSEVAQLSLDMSALQTRLEDQTSRGERQIKQQQRELEQDFEERRQLLQTDIKNKASRNQQLETRIDDLTHQLEVQKTVSLQLKQQQQRGAELEMRIKEKERELSVQADKMKHFDETTLKLNAVEVREMALEEKLREAKNSLVDKERELHTANMHIQSGEDLRLQVNSAEVRQTSLVERERETAEKLRQKELEVAASHEKMRMMEELKLKLLAEVATARAQNESLRNVEESSKQRDKELIACRDEMNRASLELTRRQDEIASLKATCGDAQHLKEEIAKLSEVKSLLQDRETRVEQLSQSLAKAEMLNGQKDREYETLVQEYDMKESECMTQAATLQASEEELREFVRVREELQLTRASLDELQVMYDRREQGIQQKADALTAGCVTVAEEHTVLQEAHRTVVEQLDASRRQNDQLTTMLSHKDFLVEEKDKQLQEGGEGDGSLRKWMHDKVAKVTDELSEARAERDEALQQVKEHRLELMQHNSELTLVQHSNHELRQLLESREETSIRAECTVDEAAAVKLEVDHLKSVIIDLQRRLRDVESDRTVCEEKLIYAGSQLSAERAQVEALKESNQSLVSQMNQTDSNVAQQAMAMIETQQLQVGYDNISAERSDLQKALKRAEIQLEEAVAKNAEMNARLNTAKATEERLRHRIDELEGGDEPPCPARAPAPHALALPPSSALHTSSENMSSTSRPQPSEQPVSAGGTPKRLGSLFMRTQNSAAKLSEVLEQSLVQDSPRSTASGQRGPSMRRPSVRTPRAVESLVSQPSQRQPTSEPPVSATSAADRIEAQLASSLHSTQPTRRGSTHSKAVFNTTAQSLTDLAGQQLLETTRSSLGSGIGAEVTEEDKPKPTLGIQLQDSNDPQSRYPKVADIKNGGPAYVAGVRKGDYLKSINKNTLTAAKDLEKLLQKIEPGNSADITFVRIKHGSASEFDSNVRIGVAAETRGHLTKKGSTGSFGGRTGSLRKTSTATGSRASSANNTPLQKSLKADAPLPLGKWM